MKRTFVAFILICLFSLPALAVSLEEGSQTFIRTLEREAIQSLTDSEKPRKQRVEAFRKLFNENFAVEAIGRWTLGRNWRQATAEEQREFLILFEDLMVSTYVDRFEQYSGEKVNIIKTVPVDENRATVHTELLRPTSVDSKPISVLWRVGRQDGIYKVLDVVVEGASMSITLQREFTSIIRNTGSVAGLLEELRKKNAELGKS